MAAQPPGSEAVTRLSVCQGLAAAGSVAPARARSVARARGAGGGGTTPWRSQFPPRNVPLPHPPTATACLGGLLSTSPTASPPFLSPPTLATNGSPPDPPPPFPSHPPTPLAFSPLRLPPV